MPSDAQYKELLGTLTANYFKTLRLIAESQPEGSDQQEAALSAYINGENKFADGTKDQDHARARREALNAASQVFKKSDIEIVALINEPTTDSGLKNILNSVFASGNDTSASLATSAANNGTSQCFTIFDDCPKFRLLIKTNLNCKDVKIKKVKITCTDSSNILSSIQPAWLKDSQVVSPLVQKEIEDRALIEFNSQVDGFSISMTSRDLNGNATPGITIEGDCLIYKTRGSYLKRFQDVRCVDRAELPHVTQLILTNLASVLTTELGEPDTTAQESLIAKILPP